MDEWIESLFKDVETAGFGTEQLIGAVWDLLNLANCGLVSRSALNERLDQRRQRDLESLETP